jgi:cell division protein FtsL
MVFLLVLAVMASAVASVYTRHETRKQFARLQGVEQQLDELQVEYSRLQIEQATQADYDRVSKIARERMGMSDPEPADQVVVHYGR